MGSANSKPKGSECYQKPQKKSRGQRRKEANEDMENRCRQHRERVTANQKERDKEDADDIKRSDMVERETKQQAEMNRERR